MAGIPASPGGRRRVRRRLRLTDKGTPHAPSRLIAIRAPPGFGRARFGAGAEAAAVYPTGQSDGARSHLDHRRRHLRPRLYGLRPVVWLRRRGQHHAANGRGAYSLGRPTHLDLHPARGAEIPRWREGAGQGLRPVAAPLGVAGFLRPGADEIRQRDRHHRRQEIRNPAEEGVPAVTVRPWCPAVVYHAGAPGPETGHRADHRSRGFGAVSVS